MNLYNLLSDTLAKQPTALAQQHLAQLISQYPFCTLAYALQAKRQAICTTGDMQPTPTLQLAAIYAPSRTALKQFLATPTANDHALHPSNQALQHNLIDAFLQAPKRTTKLLQKSIPNGDLAAYNSTLHPRLYTLPLAKLLYQQGNTQTAINVCEALKLKFPEKITYFDELINKYKQQL